MKTIKGIGRVIVVLTLCTSFQCEEHHPVDQISKLCTYKNKEPDLTNLRTTQDVCLSDNFVTELYGLNGIIKFDSDLEGFIVITNVKGTYDCQIIGVLCNDLENLPEKAVEYSGKFFEYNGAYKTPVGGQKVFLIKEFKYMEK